MLTRRDFTRNAAASAAGLALTSTAKSYASILGANDRVNVAVIGLNGRAGAHLSSLHTNGEKCAITHVVDVDTKILERFVGKTTKATGTAPKAHQDFRKMLQEKDVDAITIATPDHWHTPLALYGLKAGKHVYVEKPCSQNLHEAELLIAAQKKYNKQVVVMGNQQHSSDYTRDMVQQVQAGSLIGRAYYAKTWYTNARKSIGKGKQIPVPSNLDWDLWQGPAPRRAYTDNVHPYNWHWFHVWGTGETLNNGTHEVDVARWMLDVNYPSRVSVSGGRYHFHDDDWEFYDTLNASFEYNDKLIEWECRCCNDMPIYGRERGVAVHGTEGTLIIDRDGYEVHDLKGKSLKEWQVPKAARTSSSDTVGRDGMTDAHFRNWLDAIRTGSKLDQPIDDAAISVGTLLMANIAYDLKKELKVSETGAFINDPAATAKRRRTYEKGWEPTI